MQVAKTANDLKIYKDLPFSICHISFFIWVLRSRSIVEVDCWAHALGPRTWNMFSCAPSDQKQPSHLGQLLVTRHAISRRRNLWGLLFQRRPRRECLVV